MSATAQTGAEMPTTNPKAAMNMQNAHAHITLGIDFSVDSIWVDAFVTSPCGTTQRRSFGAAVDASSLALRLPEWLAELRAEVALGRNETLAEQRDRLVAQSVAVGVADTTSLNSTCTSRLPGADGPRSLIR